MLPLFFLVPLPGCPLPYIASHALHSGIRIVTSHKGQDQNTQTSGLGGETPSDDRGVHDLPEMLGQKVDMSNKPITHNAWSFQI